VEEVIENKASPNPNERSIPLNTAAPSTHFLPRRACTWIPATRCGCWTWATSARHAAHLRRAKLVASTDDQRGQATIVFPDSLITKGTSSTTCALTWRAAAAGFCVHPGFLSGAGSGIIRGGSSHRQRGAGGCERSHRAARPGFPRDLEGKPFVIQATVTPRFTGIGRGRRHRGFGGPAAGVLLPDCQPELCIPWMPPCSQISPNRRAVPRRSRTWATRAKWALGSGRAGARLSDERGVQAPSCGSIRSRERRTLSTSLRRCSKPAFVWPDSAGVWEDGTL